MERKIVSCVSNDYNRSIAANCYTSIHRKVKYIANIENVDLNTFDILLLTSKNSLENLSEVFMESFDSIVVLNSSSSIENLEIQGYSKVNVSDKVIFFKKNNGATTNLPASQAGLMGKI
jgi:uroporphyrinogen-III synthase